MIDEHIAVAETRAGPEAAAGALARADLLYCLARAFLSPPAGWPVTRWAPPLADDLAELGEALGLDTAAARAALHDACERRVQAQGASADADDWLVQYSRLFLVPPVAVPLNTGLYLEGSVGGTSAQMMRACYRVAGVEPDETFCDLPDHVAMQLEFLARLHERAARGDADAAAMADEFCRAFVDAWVDALEASCRRAECGQPAARVYTEFVRLLKAALAGTADSSSLIG